TTRISTGSATYCCLAHLDGIDIVTGNSEWVSPRAAAADTWTADTERKELAAHEYVHVWQGELGGTACMLGPRWLSEGMAEWLAAFAQAFGEPTDAFYARFESFRSAYLR